MNEVKQIAQPVPRDDEIGLRELFSVLWAGKWWIGGISFAAVILAVIVALMLPNVYRAEALLAPNDQNGAGGLSTLAAQYGGLASLAGINLQAGSADKTALGLEVLKSRKFISEFIGRHEILVPLMASKSWDAETGNLLIDPDDYDVESQQWVRTVRAPKRVIPTLQEAYDEFTRILSVVQNKKTGFVTVSIDHLSPEIAKLWVDWFVSDLNSSIMQQEVAEAEQAIAYLKRQIANTSRHDLRNVFFRLIEEKTKIVMLAEVTDEYVFKIVDPSVVPELKQSPDRILITVLAAILGVIAGSVVVVAKQSYSRSRTR